MSGNWTEVYRSNFGYVAIARPASDGYAMEFRIVSHFGTGEDGADLYGYGHECAVHAIADAPTDVQGFIKWDGCSHLQWGEQGADGNPAGYTHVCGADAWLDLMAAMGAVIRHAAATIPTWDGCGDIGSIDRAMVGFGTAAP